MIESGEVGTVQACPECDWCKVSERVSERPRYLCRGCGAEFDTPNERPAKYLAERIRRAGVPEVDNDG